MKDSVILTREYIEQIDQLVAEKNADELKLRLAEMHPADIAEMCDDMSIEDKIRTVAREIYGADGVVFEPAAKKALADILAINPEYAKFPVCMAKTQYSLSDDQTKLGRPKNFDITVRDVKLSAGAGFIVVLTGAIMTMPGLPKAPAAYRIDIDEESRISGLF